MASPPAASPRRSPASSSASLKHSAHDEPQAPAISVDTLVNHLLVSKRSLSSMNLVLRANEIATAARNAHEDSLILAAQIRFLRGSILDQIAILMRVRRSIHATYDWGKRDFKKLVRAMDDVDGELGATMEMLRGTEVQHDLRPSEGERRNLLDFVDETGVHAMREAMKKSIEEFQGIQQSFDGDLLRFETDIRNLKRVISDLPLSSSDSTGTARRRPMVELLLTMDEHSSTMAQLLASLTKHFDMCVTAIRTTEGAAALARRKAAEVTQSQDSDGVSISGVIAEQESHMSDLEPKTAEDRAEMLKVVMQDADEVDDVVREGGWSLDDLSWLHGPRGPALPRSSGPEHREPRLGVPRAPWGVGRTPGSSPPLLSPGNTTGIQRWRKRGLFGTWLRNSFIGVLTDVVVARVGRRQCRALQAGLESLQIRREGCFPRKLAHACT